MRFKEFKLPINEFVQPAGDPGNDLAYLITHTELSPEIKKMIGDTLKGLATEPETKTLAPQPQAQQPVQPQQQPAPVQNKTPVGEPMGQAPVGQDDAQLKEAKTPEEVELLAYIKGVKNKAELGKLLYVVRDGQFKKMASEIVKNKIKFKPRETYELIKNRIRSLSTRVPVAVMTDFLNDCKVGGVIDTEGMISGDLADQTRIPLVDPRFQKIAEVFLDLNLERLGKGEIGLAFMGINAVKETSDISIGGQAIEVKATKGKSDFFMKGNPDEGGFGYQAEAVKILVNALNKAGANLKPTNRSKQGGIAAIGRTNLPKLNQYFALLKQDGTYKVLMDVLKELNKKDPGVVDPYAEELMAAISPNGTIDYNALGLVTAKINFDYYKKMSHHDGIMVLNLNSFQFIYITDANTWASYVDSGVLQQMYALDFRTNGLGGISYTMNAIQ